MDREQAITDQVLARLAAPSVDPREAIDGPITLLSSTLRPDGGSDWEFSAARLIALDPDDISLRDAFLALPAAGRATVGANGSVEAIELPAPAPDDEAQARAWARNLVAVGAVDGVAPSVPAYGPPARPTHELLDDGHGRRILRRIGFAGA